MTTGYKFPIINNISDVMPAIADREEFIIADRGTFKICNYIVNFIDTFPSIYDENGNYNLIAALRRECRGIAFDAATGDIIRRPFGKFFNINEKLETQLHALDFALPHKIYTKLDGSFITPFKVAKSSDVICYGTKMGRTTVSEIAEEYVKNNKNYHEFSKWCIQNMLSPTYELTSRKQRIVIDYPEEKMTLLAIRDIVTGEYLDIENVPEIQKYNIPTVESHGSVINPKEFIENVANKTGIEGYVIAWDNGYRVKLKTEEYCLIHKTKDQMNFEKNIVSMILNDQVDDIKTFMLDADRKILDQFEDKFNQGLAETVKKYNAYFNAVAVNMERKDWAINCMPDVKKYDVLLPNIVFGLYQGHDTRTMIIDYLKKNCNTQTKIDSVRYLWGGAKWNYYFESD